MRMKRMHELPAHHQLNSQFVRNVFNASCTYHFIILLLCSIMLILSLSRPTIPEVHENRLQFYDRREIVAFTVTYVSHNHTITISKNTTKVCHLLKSTNNIVRSCLCQVSIFSFWFALLRSILYSFDLCLFCFFARTHSLTNTFRASVRIYSMAKIMNAFCL